MTPLEMFYAPAPELSDAERERLTKHVISAIWNIRRKPKPTKKGPKGC